MKSESGNTRTTVKTCMIRFRTVSLVYVVAICCAAYAAAPRRLRLPSVFGDGAVLQRDIPIPVWGWAAPGDNIEVGLGTQVRTVVAQPDGTWRAMLEPVAAGPLGNMTVRTANQAITVRNLLGGEVWVCSGQSNMQMSVAASQGAEEALQKSNDDQLRLFMIPRIAKTVPAEDVSARWLPSQPSNAAAFSAVGYYFAKELRFRLRVPVGMIMAAWGGTTAEVWTDRRALESDPEFSPILMRWDQRIARNPAVIADGLPFKLEVAEMELVRADGSRLRLTGSGAGNSDWDAPACGESSRAAITGSTFAGSLGIAGFASVMRRLNASGDPADVSGFSTLRLRARGQGAFYLELRQPSVVDGACHAVPRFFAGPEWKEYTFSLADFSQPSWGEQKPLTLHQVSGFAICTQAAMPLPEQPGALFQSMLKPVIPFGIRGALWYQGEGNSGRAYQYRRLLPALIGSWRRAWGQGDFPFYIVQLPGYGPVSEVAVDSAWAEMREAQTAALEIANTGLVCTIDLGEPGNVHPRNKAEVGVRLAQLALDRTYRIDADHSGPKFKSATIEGDRIRVKFTDLWMGLASNDGKPLIGFSLAGEDRVFKKAAAVIDGDTIVVQSPEVPRPLAVRYAWASSPVCNLVGANGLPAWPFRSDDWPGITTEGR
jgi:sialate O-acetylesterase